VESALRVQQVIGQNDGSGHRAQQQQLTLFFHIRAIIYLAVAQVGNHGQTIAECVVEFAAFV
jgi:hypothetical protein